MFFKIYKLKYKDNIVGIRLSVLTGRGKVAFSLDTSDFKTMLKVVKGIIGPFESKVDTDEMYVYKEDDMFKTRSDEDKAVEFSSKEEGISLLLNFFYGGKESLTESEKVALQYVSDYTGNSSWFQIMGYNIPYDSDTDEFMLASSILHDLDECVGDVSKLNIPIEYKNDYKKALKRFLS